MGEEKKFNLYIDKTTSDYKDYYSKCMVSMSHLTGSMTGIIVDYILSAFGDKFFKGIWNSLSEPYVQRAAAFRDFMKKPRPLMLIIPKFDPSEESNFRPLSEFDAEVTNDPAMIVKYGLRGAQLISDKPNYQLFFRPRQFKISFAISFVFDSDIQRIQAQQYIRQSIRHRMPIPLMRRIENYIPNEYMEAIASLNGYKIGSDELDEFLNIDSYCPIKYRFRTGIGKYEYFASIDTPIEVQFTEAPSSDGPIKKGNIVVQSSFSENIDVVFTAPSVYFLRTPTKVTESILIEQESESVIPVAESSVIEGTNPGARSEKDIPMGANIINGMAKYKSLNVQADKDGTDSINFSSLITDERILKVIECYKSNGMPLNEIINATVFEGTTELPLNRYLLNHSSLELTIYNMTIYKEYYIMIYVNTVKVNDVIDKMYKTDSMSTTTL